MFAAAAAVVVVVVVVDGTDIVDASVCFNGWEHFFGKEGDFLTESWLS